MFLPLDLPAGMYANGTDMQQSGRWRDGSLVRWREGIMQPVGGWRDRTSSVVNAAPRGAVSWQDNGGDRWVAVGTFNSLYVISASGALSDITPAGLTVGIEDAAVNTGFGGGFFGTGFYGAPRPDNGNYSEATTWSMGTWGEYLIACSPDDGTIYEWQLVTGSPAAALANAPVDCLAAHVTGERFIFALGAGGNPRRVDWCDREDNTVWAEAATNEAGSFELDTGGQIMCSLSIRGQTLILTDTDAHVANYVGPPFVYGFERVGTSCGALSRGCVAGVEGGAIWMGPQGFFGYFGGSVEPIPCDVSDRVFEDLSRPQQSKIYAVANAQHREVWWFYPSASAVECDRYVSYNYHEKIWMFGDIDRTCGIDRGVFAQPIWMDSGGRIYDHEIGTNYDDEVVFAESGPVSLGNGDQVYSVNQLIPDERTQGDVTVKLKTRLYPNDTEREYGPYTMSAPTDVRVTGRQVRLRVEGARLAAWRWGVPRLKAMLRGGR